MALVVYPLNNTNYGAEDAETYFATRTSGVFGGDDYTVDVGANGDTVVVSPGLAWISNKRFSGKSVVSKESVELSIPTAHVSLPRIDAVVIRLSVDANNNGGADIIIKQGTAAADPVAPAITQTETVYELCVATFYREAGRDIIDGNDITDTRADKSVCGYMEDAVTATGTPYIVLFSGSSDNGEAEIDPGLFADADYRSIVVQTIPEDNKTPSCVTFDDIQYWESPFGPRLYAVKTIGNGNNGRFDYQIAYSDTGFFVFGRVSYGPSGISERTERINFSKVVGYKDQPYINAGSGSGDVDQEYNPLSANAQSGTAVAEAISTKQDELTFDSTPTFGSDNPVKSGGVYTAIAGKQDTLTFDNSPTSGSNNPVKSGGIYTALSGKQNTLTAGENISIVGNVISALSSGGMTEITDQSDLLAADPGVYWFDGSDDGTFVIGDPEAPDLELIGDIVFLKVTESSGNHEVWIFSDGHIYVASGSYDAEYLTPAEMLPVDQTYSASSTHAQSGTAVAGALAGKQDSLTFDDEPVSGSSNPVTSGGIYSALGDKQNVLSWDDTPTYQSEAPVKSGGIYTALEGKQDTLTFDNAPTENSSNPVTSDGIYDALGTKQDTLTFDALPTQGSNNPVTSAGIYSAISSIPADTVPIRAGNGINSAVIGSTTNAANGTNCVSSGQNAFADGPTANASGYCTVAYGTGAHAEGYFTNAINLRTGSLAYSYGSHSEGRWSLACGISSHSENGIYTLSHGEIYLTGAAGATTYSYTTGHNLASPQPDMGICNGDSEPTPVVPSSIQALIVSVDAANGTITLDRSLNPDSAFSAKRCRLLGTSYGTASHAEGHMNVAYGAGSHVGGGFSRSTGIRSFAHGEHVVANEANQFVIGKYNADNADALFIVGNGTAEDSRSNAFYVNADGTTSLDTKINESAFWGLALAAGVDPTTDTSTYGNYSAAAKTAIKTMLGIS